jgi:hypothetical protein
MTKQEENKALICGVFEAIDAGNLTTGRPARSCRC